MSDSNRVALGIVPEVTPGTTPATPAIQALRTTGQPSLAFTPQTVTTDEIRSDAQITDLILVGAEAGGDVGHEISANTLDTIIQAALRNSFTLRNNRQNIAGVQISDITSNVVTITDESNEFQVGDIIYFDGFGDANDGVVATVTVATTLAITVGSGLTDNASPPTTAHLRNVGFAGVADDIDSTATPNTITTAADDFTTMELAVGQWVKLNGFVATPANNGWCRISAIAALTLTFDIVPAGWAAETPTGVVSIYAGDTITNSTTLTQFTIERRYTDISVFEYFTGMAVNTFNMSLTQQAIATAVAGFIGFNANVQTSRFAGATDVLAPTTSVFNTSTNVARIARGGSAISGSNFVTELTVAINNNLRRQNAVANLGAIGVGSGEFNLTGTLNTYFDDEVLLNEVLNNTETSLDFVMTANSGKSLLIDIPRTKYSSGAPSVPGKNQDVFLSLGYQGLRHPTLGYTVLMQRHWFTA